MEFKSEFSVLIKKGTTSAFGFLFGFLYPNLFVSKSLFCSSIRKSRRVLIQEIMLECLLFLLWLFVYSVNCVKCVHVLHG